MAERHIGRTNITIHEGKLLEDKKIDEWLQILREDRDDARTQIGYALEWQDPQAIDFIKRARHKDPRTIELCFSNFLENDIFNQS